MLDLVVETSATSALSSFRYNAKVLRLAVEFLTQMNEAWIEEFGPVPLYSSGVYYEPENGVEIWPDIGRCLKRGFGDCEDLACWRAAMLRHAGEKASPELLGHPRGDGGVEYHVVVRRGDGSIEDPSLLLGRKV